tara:strand:+ start:867 stop:2132 length:1266 start_codon:yes stop_codon:yes gene_type:complete
MKMLKTMLCLLALSMTFHACSYDEDGTGPDESTTAPTVYEFVDADGNSTVSYSGQVVRCMLIKDIKTLATTDGTTADDLNSMYTNDETNQARTILTTTDPASVQTTYGAISTKNLSGKIAPADYGNVYGFDTDPHTLVTAWFDAAAIDQYSSTGLDVPQMIQKFLLGSVSFYQATTNYMTQIETDDNTTASDPDAGKYYTDMEHHWDESFGYFGAAKDYGNYTDAEIKSSTPYFDSNDDGSIDFLSEYCNGISINAAKRDVGAVDGSVDFTKTIFDAYLMGRHLISEGADLSDILAQRAIVELEWEKLLAANAIHYINDTIGDIDNGTWDGTEDATCRTSTCTDYMKHYSEMRAFAMGLQFNSRKTIEDDDLHDVLDHMGIAPIFPGTGDVNAFKESLLEARNILRDVPGYNFTDEVVAGW